MGATAAEPDLSETQQLIAAARALGPLIREHADEGERERRLSRKVLTALADSGLYRLMLPRSLGGWETDPITCSRVVEELAHFDSAAGWSLQAGNEGAWWAARFPEDGTDEIYANNPSAIMSASFHPPQQAVETAGGYRITGRGPLASNIHDAEWLFVTALVTEGGRPRMVSGAPEMIGVVTRASEARIIDTWQSLGMRGTDSNDVVVDDLFVPASRAFRLLPEYEPARRFEGPLYRFPASGISVVFVAPVPLAVARRAIDEVSELAQRKTPFGFAKPLRERAAVQSTIAQAEGKLRAARLFYYDTLRQVWEGVLAGETVTLRQKADILLAGSHAATTAASVTDMMHRIAGTTGIYARNPLERLFRDAQTLRHHGFVSENRFEAVGQVYLGIQPEFVMVAF